jgi:RNA polymerase sigma factor (sigma-70 family)
MESRELLPVENEDKIFEKNESLVHSLLQNCFKNDSKNLNYEDLRQEGYIGLIKAIRTFDESKGVKFGYYATICIRNEIREYIMRNRYNGLKVAKSAQYEAMKQGRGAVDDLVDKYSVQLYGDQIPDSWRLKDENYAPSAEEEALAGLCMDEAIEQLYPERYRELVWKYIETLSVRKTTEEMGVSRDTVYDALKRLKEIYYKNSKE